MSQIYAHMTAEGLLPCTESERDAIQAVLDECDEPHGVSLFYDKRDGLFIYADENCNEGSLPDKFFELVGKLIQKAGKPHMEFGVGFYHSKDHPGCSGGYAFRIYPDGGIEYRNQNWDGDKHAKTSFDVVKLFDGKFNPLVRVGPDYDRDDFTSYSNEQEAVQALNDYVASGDADENGEYAVIKTRVELVESKKAKKEKTDEEKTDEEKTDE